MCLPPNSGIASTSAGNPPPLSTSWFFLLSATWLNGSISRYIRHRNNKLISFTVVIPLKGYCHAWCHVVSWPSMRNHSYGRQNHLRSSQNNSKRPPQWVVRIRCQAYSSTLAWGIFSTVDMDRDRQNSLNALIALGMTCRKIRREVKGILFTCVRVHDQDKGVELIEHRDTWGIYVR